MLIDLLRFEWRYHTRQVTFPAAAVLFFLFGFGVTSTGFGPDNVHINSPYSIVQSVGVLSLPAVFILALFCTSAIVRDREHRMEEVVFGTAVQKFQLLLGRFGGSFLAAFTAFSASILGMISAVHVPWHEAQRIGAFHPTHYLFALLAIALPNLILGGVLLFGIAALTRSSLASYTGAVFIYVLYLVSAAFTNSPLMAASTTTARHGASLSALLDPFALSAFFEQTQYWSAARRDREIVSLTGTLLQNRLLWIGIAATIFGLTYRFFTFGLLAEGAKKSTQSRAAQVARSVTYAAVTPASGIGTEMASCLSALRIEVRALLSVPFAAVVLLWTGLAYSEMLSTLSGREYGSSVIPLTGLALGAIDRPFHLLTLIVLIYYCGEIVWRERLVRFADVANATPASNFSLMLARWLALVAIVAAFIAATIATALLFQVTHGFFEFDVRSMVRFAYFDGLPLVLFAALTLLVQVACGNKYAGMLVSLLAGILITRGESLHLDHHLLRFGTAPATAFSFMGGTIGSAAFHWYSLLWIAVAALMLAITGALWRRPAGERLLRTMGAEVRGSSAGARVSVATLVVVIAGAASFIAWNTTVRNEFVTQASITRWKASYERQYRTLASLPQPRITRILATVDLEPERGSYRVRGRYTLLNTTNAPIGQLIVVNRREARDVRMTVAGARLNASDPRFGQRAFRFEPPLLPGRDASLEFDLAFPSNGFNDDGPETSVVPNGSVLMNFRALPSIGYRTSYEISDPDERRRQGLTRLQPSTESELTPADSGNSEEWVQLDLTVSTTPDQVVVAPGRMERSWNSKGRRYFHFTSDKAIRNSFSILSSRYVMQSDRINGTTIETYYDPRHADNVPRIRRAASHSLEQFSRRFGAYPYSTLRLAAVPMYWSFGGFAQPGEVLLNEERVMLVGKPGPSTLDLVTRRVAHEVAHQWWGHNVVAANLPGASMLTETLTKDSELLIIRQLSGPGHVRAALRFELDRYLRERVGARREPSLMNSGDEPFLYYRKGAIVMNAIRDLLGDDAMDLALRRFVAAQGGPGHQPTTSDLLGQLAQGATPKQQALIIDLMTTVSLYDYKLKSARASKRADGRFDVRLVISAEKTTTAPDGRESAVPFRDDVAIGLFTGEIDDPAQKHVALHLERHPLRNGDNQIAIVVNQKPRIAAIDPYITRIDTNPENNNLRIE